MFPVLCEAVEVMDEQGTAWPAAAAAATFASAYAGWLSKRMLVRIVSTVAKVMIG
jgi:hypothetical protein